MAHFAAGTNLDGPMLGNLSGGADALTIEPRNLYGGIAFYAGFQLRPGVDVVLSSSKVVNNLLDR